MFIKTFKLLIQYISGLAKCFISDKGFGYRLAKSLETTSECVIEIRAGDTPVAAIAPPAWYDPPARTSTPPQSPTAPHFDKAEATGSFNPISSLMR